MIRQLLIIFGCLYSGKFFVGITGAKLPPSIVGLFLMLLLLMTGLVKIKDVEGVGNFFNKNIAFFFVPAGVAIMAYFGMLVSYFWTILLSTIVSIILVLIVTGWSHQLLRKKRK